MKYERKQNLVCTDSDYRVGRHYRWEVEAHVAAQTHREAHGRSWSYDERITWIENYMSRTPLYIQNEVTRCPVCTEVIADCMLRNVSPWKVPEEVKARLAEYAVRFRYGSRLKALLHGEV